MKPELIPQGGIVITNNVIARTFHIRIDGSSGTCFTIDVDGKQYIITAKHVADSINDTSTISMFQDNQWRDIVVTPVGHCEGEIDISVLTTNIKLSHTLPLPPTMDGICYGQDVYFLGFPYDITEEIGNVNRDFPFPFAKKAIVSVVQEGPAKPRILFLDGHNNPGFSGGPVIFKETGSGGFKVAGVISGYHFNKEPIYHDDQQLPLTYRYNTGIIISYGIEHAIDLIHANPIGFILNV